MSKRACSNKRNRVEFDDESAGAGAGSGSGSESELDSTVRAKPNITIVGPEEDEEGFSCTAGVEELAEDGSARSKKKGKRRLGGPGAPDSGAGVSNPPSDDTNPEDVAKHFLPKGEHLIWHMASGDRDPFNGWLRIVGGAVDEILYFRVHDKRVGASPSNRLTAFRGIRVCNRTQSCNVITAQLECDITMHPPPPLQSSSAFPQCLTMRTTGVCDCVPRCPDRVSGQEEKKSDQTDLPPDKYSVAVRTRDLWSVLGSVRSNRPFVMYQKYSDTTSLYLATNRDDSTPQLFQMKVFEDPVAELSMECTAQYEFQATLPVSTMKGILSFCKISTVICFALLRHKKDANKYIVRLQTGDDPAAIMTKSDCHVELTEEDAATCSAAKAKRALRCVQDGEGHSCVTNDEEWQTVSSSSYDSIFLNKVIRPIDDSCCVRCYLSVQDGPMILNFGFPTPCTYICLALPKRSE